MRTSRLSTVLATVSLMTLVAATSAAQAGAFGIREQSATAQGLSFAGTASGSGGLSSIFWNPATITMAPGWQSENHFAVILPDARINPVPPTPTIGFGPSGNIGLDAIVPSSYGSYQVNDRLWLGLAVNGPFGLATKPNQDWAGQIYSRSSRIFSANFNPIVGFKVNEWLSIGGGPMVEYFDVHLKRAVPPNRNPRFAPLATLPGAPGLTLEGDDVGVGFSAGVTVTPFNGTQIGVGFRSSIHHELEGSLRAPFLVTPVTAKVNTPEQLTVGLTQQLTPDLKLDLGFEWMNWSRLGSPAVVLPTAGVTGPITLNYRDGYHYSVGLEYQATRELTLRTGLAYEESPIGIDNRSTRIPDNDRIWASIGAGYRWNEKLSFDVAYSHLFVRDTKIAISSLPGSNTAEFATAGLPFFADVDSRVDIVSVGLKYRWDNPVKPIPAPIVAKN